MDQKQYTNLMIAQYSERSAAGNSAYMLPLLKPTMQMLDVGCGPGTISLDLASYVPDGHLTGLDMSSTAIDSAKELAEKRGVQNASFQVGSILDLPFDDDSFDVVHAHQVLGHVVGGEGAPGPVRALREMRRVCKPGGFVCAREADWSSLVLYPAIPGTKESFDMMEKLGLLSGKTIAGGRGREFARRAGFSPERITSSAIANTKSGRAERESWGENMALRLEQSSTLSDTIEKGFITEEEGTGMVKAWREWAKHDDAFYCRVDGQIVCEK